MGLLRIYPIAILIFQLYGARGENLPELQENKLLLNDARNLPAIPLYIECSERGHTPPRFVFKNMGTLKPSEVLNIGNNIFRQVSFTSAVVPGVMEREEIIENKKAKVGGIGKFGFAKMEHKSGILGMGTTMTVYALHVHPKGEPAYWLPQGGFVDIPQIPTNAHPKYVFTTNFSGCSWTVTPLSNGFLRLRHVNGGKELPEFNSLSLTEKGGTRSYAMQYRDYGYVQLSNHGNQRFENAMGYAYMHFSNGAWKLYVQQKTCAPLSGLATFKKNEDLVSITMSYSNKDNYEMISGTKDFRIP